jgi:hypothetical protein
VTYDITAWSLPYAYGLQSYALRQPLEPVRDSLPGIAHTNANLIATRPYAYLARWNSLKDVRFLAALLQRRIRVRFAEGAFIAGGKSFPAGTLIITRAGNETTGVQFDEQVVALANMCNTGLDAVNTGFVEKGVDFGSDKVRFIKPLKIAVVMGEGISSLAAGEVWHFFEQQIEYPLTVVDEKRLNAINWKTLDVLILPDGYYKYLADKETAARLKDWIAGGGKLIAMQDALAQLATLDWGIKLKKAEEEKEEKTDNYGLLKSYGNREREGVKQLIPGAIYKVLLDTTHPLAFGFPEIYYTLKQDSKIYEYLESGGWNVGVLKKDNYLSGFVGTETRKKLKDGLLFGVKDIGQGQVIMLADDPLFRSFWENGKLLFGNALFMTGN